MPIEGLADDAPRFPLDTLIAFASTAFVHVGLNQDDADVASHQLLMADLRGIESHGMARLSGYVDRLARKLIDPDAQLTIDRETPVSVAWDAHNGLGLLMGPRAMTRVVEKAQETGLAIGTVRESNHFGAVGTYVRQATDLGMGGMAMTNAAAIVVPTYSSRPLLGTNPLAIGIPAPAEHPLIIDMSTSTVAWGKIEIARRAGVPLPAGWALDENGASTTDPTQVRGLTSLGSSPQLSSHKGYGLGMMVDIFCGPLAGNPTSTGITSAARGGAGSTRTGHAFMAWRVDAFREPEAFEHDIREMIAEYRNTPVSSDAPVDRIILPGEPEWRAEVENTERGIPVRNEVLSELREMCDRHAIAFTLD